MQNEPPVDPKLAALAELPLFAADEVNVLWLDGYYDGPLSGLAEYRAERLYFECVDETGHGRTYTLYRLSPERLAAAESRHTEFEGAWAHVKASGGGSEELRAAVPPYEGPDLSSAEPVGQFRW